MVKPIVIVKRIVTAVGIMAGIAIIPSLPALQVIREPPDSTAISDCKEYARNNGYVFIRGRFYPIDSFDHINSRGHAVYRVGNRYVECDD